MVRFILNDRLVETGLAAGSSLLDFIRYEQNLPGTKIGCREGDCGACTVLEGQLENGRLVYKSITSCLAPLGNAHGKHIVTVEGLNMEKLSPVQLAFVEENATQCGFCTPGFVVAISGYAINAAEPNPVDAIDSMNGNICRCTGYKSIERAAISISRLLAGKNPANPMQWLVDKGFLPGYFQDIPNRIAVIAEGHAITGEEEKPRDMQDVVLGGGTDLMVQKPDEVHASRTMLVFNRPEMKGIRREHNRVVIGASATANDIMHSPVLAELFTDIKDYFRLISSDPIRNMGTLAGNLVNASPIGDLSIFFLAMGSGLNLYQPATGEARQLALKDFFLGYKKLDLQAGELVMSLFFEIPETPYQFNFEKVSKRTHLDIASVNAAAFLQTDGDMVTACRLSCGGVGPVPLYLEKTSDFFTGRRITPAILIEANEILQKEISPISDIRGSMHYKGLLARQLLFAHFLKFFPERLGLNELVPGLGSGRVSQNDSR
jgi:xanthine dehydrogenase small subunit